MENRIKTIMSEVLNIPKDEITDETSNDNVSDWDSMQHVVLVIEFERELGIKISVDDIIELTSYPAIIETLKRYVGRAPETA